MLTKVIEQAKIDHFTKWFERADKIVIVSHVSPDGDAIGSSLGLYHFLDSQEKQTFLMERGILTKPSLSPFI
jgi:bifunctional oligoribonuclease and PAP phosphatase NrnA